MLEKINEKYRALPLPLKATAWYTICQFLQKGIGILTSPFVARLLSTEEYGRTNTFTSWEGLFMMLVTLSSFQSVNYLCAKHDKGVDTLSSLLGYNIIVSLLWGIFLYFNASIITNITGMSALLQLCLYLCCVFSSFILCWRYVKMYEYSYKYILIETGIYTSGVAFGGLASIIAVF